MTRTDIRCEFVIDGSHALWMDPNDDDKPGSVTTKLPSLLPDMLYENRRRPGHQSRAAYRGSKWRQQNLHRSSCIAGNACLGISRIYICGGGKSHRLIDARPTAGSEFSRARFRQTRGGFYEPFFSGPSLQGTTLRVIDTSRKRLRASHRRGGCKSHALAQPAEAEIVYTPANATIPFDRGLTIDLNHDGRDDFRFFFLHLRLSLIREN